MSHRSTPMLVSLLVVMAVATATLPGWPETCPTLTTCFTPGQNCTDAIVLALNDAKRTILVQAYSFTSAPIAKALLEAHKRGVQGRCQPICASAMLRQRGGRVALLSAFRRPWPCP